LARRTNIRRRGKSWVVYFRVGGRQVWRSFRTREEAELYLANAQVKRATGEFRAPVKIRFAEFAHEWLKTYARVNVSPKTFDGYESSLRIHLIPEFGDLYLTEITRKAVDSFVADWATGGPRFEERLRLAREHEHDRARKERRHPRAVRLGHSPKTIANALVPFREMLGHAVEWGYLSANPAERVRRPRAERNPDDMQILDADQVLRLLASASEEARTLLLCAVTTGMRRGELLGLRWGDVDWGGRRVWVRRSVGPDGRFQQPKTRGSVRAIALTPTLVSALRLHRMASSFKGEDDLIFPSEGGTPLDGRNMVRQYFEPALRKAGLPRMRFHDLRHTYASLLIAQGEHPKLISEQLGHASIQITLDRYGHLMDQSYGDASERLEAVLFGNQRRSSRPPQFRSERSSSSAHGAG
jgi:integrase